MSTINSVNQLVSYFKIIIMLVRREYSGALSRHRAPCRLTNYAPLLSLLTNIIINLKVDYFANVLTEIKYFNTKIY